MKVEPITFFNRYSGKVEEEAIYGEKWLRWSYETAPGRLFLNLLVRRPFFSKLYGRAMNKPKSKVRIAPFIEKYGIDSTEFRAPADSFASFNDFFHRRLKPEARPIAPGEEIACFPADGRHLGYQSLAETDSFIAKGERFDLRRFLQDDELAERYADGAAIVSRLCPVDYHRYHFPCDGIAGESRLINGWLYSVNPIALRQNVGYLAANKRSYSLLESPIFGTVLYAEIGATCVGSLVNTYLPGKPVEKGAEKGYFKFGGSCTILLFEKGRIRLDSDLVENTAQNRELYAKMGDRLGSAC
ncbi:MAG TPA: phosphatidylserine decarboxylase [Opitutales bacterium]|nr:phosphatidylserine decarboxylase [Opitutales bacterium]